MSFLSLAISTADTYKNTYDQEHSSYKFVSKHDPTVVNQRALSLRPTRALKNGRKDRSGNGNTKVVRKSKNYESFFRSYNYNGEEFNYNYGQKCDIKDKKCYEQGKRWQ